ncbi:glycosyltransferase family A protein [Micrococcaceae bacterium Sec5.7]
MSQSIEVVIPVHDPERPIERGIRSVIDQLPELSVLGVSLRVTVVCHNMDTADLLVAELSGHEAVSWLTFTDGVKSPAGPRNFALARSSATYLSFLDSDDFLEPGSLAAWWKVAQENNAAAVIAPLRTPEGFILPSPRIRPSKPAVLDAVRDGLAYRSVPYGLLRRESLLKIGYRYAEGVPTGEDIEPTLKLWFRSGAVCYPYGAPAYHQTDDSGAARVTSSIRPLQEEFQWLDRLMKSEWLLQATQIERRSIALKILRVHGVGALVRRADAAGLPGPSSLWDETERQRWAGLADRLFAFAGGSLPALSRRDAALTQAAAEASDARELVSAVERHQKSGRPGELLTDKPFSVLARDSVLRHYLNERRRMKAGVFAGH